jgi:hypothetical protein
VRAAPDASKHRAVSLPRSLTNIADDAETWWKMISTKYDPDRHELSKI